MRVKTGGWPFYGHIYQGEQSHPPQTPPDKRGGAGAGWFAPWCLVPYLPRPPKTPKMTVSGPLNPLPVLSFVSVTFYQSKPINFENSNQGKGYDKLTLDALRSTTTRHTRYSGSEEPTTRSHHTKHDRHNTDNATFAKSIDHDLRLRNAFQRVCLAPRRPR